jgi:hypothetical protein
MLSKSQSEDLSKAILKSVRGALKAPGGSNPLLPYTESERVALVAITQCTAAAYATAAEQRDALIAADIHALTTMVAELEARLTRLSQ